MVGAWGWAPPKGGVLGPIHHRQPCPMMRCIHPTGGGRGRGGTDHAQTCPPPPRPQSPSMPGPNPHAPQVFHDKLYVLHGYDGVSGSDEVFEYDPAHQRWKDVEFTGDIEVEHRCWVAGSGEGYGIRSRRGRIRRPGRVGYKRGGHVVLRAVGFCYVNTTCKHDASTNVCWAGESAFLRPTSP